jgi:NADH-quinone oxidoreductase subunit F
MKKIIVGMSTCGMSAGAKETYKEVERFLVKNQSKATLSIAGCIGMCYREPLVEIREEGVRTIYGDMTAQKISGILDQHINNNQVIAEHVVYREDIHGKKSGQEVSFLGAQNRIVLQRCGFINPESLEEYEETQGYQATRKAMLDMTPEQILEEIKESGLRGRGGAGFPTGLKWSFAAKTQSDIKYVVCNADEGDPGAFMDRSVLEGDPHSILEGMIICGKAIGANFGYIYCRAEYPLAIKRLEIAIEAARQKGFLGNNILNSGFDFDVVIKQGAGAFVCGEETALFASIEGQRGMPRIRPPFPAEEGVWKKPTNNNNVETYANIAWIILNGNVAYKKFGSEKSPGTKVFALAGKVNRGGLAEVDMGTTIEDLVFKIGGGIKEGRVFKAVQMGGPSGGCIPEHLKNTPVDFENIPKTGAIMGSGGMVVMDDATCMVDIARFFLDFTQDESCGKCTFCRIGTLRMLEILEGITHGEGGGEDIEKLKTLGKKIKEASLCGLGQTAPNPVLTTIHYYLNEYEAHIHLKKCPAKSCSLLVSYNIDEEKCTGCGLCVKNCPADAITGEKKQVHIINHDICVKCGKCITSCSFNAVYKD